MRQNRETKLGAFMSLDFATTTEQFAHLRRDYQSADSGAVVNFQGRVRATNHEKNVAFLDYEAHEPLARSMFEQLVHEAIKLFALHHAHALHRLGRVLPGETSVEIITSAAHRHQAFSAGQFLMDELKQTLPIWRKEVYVDGSSSFSHEACSHARHSHADILKSARVALHAHHIDVEDLAAKKVLLIGAGGLGCPLALNLSAAGIKNLTIFDGDVVEQSNLGRQHVYQLTDVGRSKALLLRTFLLQRYPLLLVDAQFRSMSESLFPTIAQDFDLIIDATDNRSIKRMIRAQAHHHAVPLVSVSIHQLDGEVQIYQPGTNAACLNCHSNSDDNSAEKSCATVGVLAHHCYLVSAIACEQALVLLARRAYVGARMILIDPVHTRMTSLVIEKDPRCISCAPKRYRLVRLRR